MCFYWKFLPEDYLLLTIFDPRIKNLNKKVVEKEMLCKKYDECKEDYSPIPIVSHQLYLEHQLPFMNLDFLKFLNKIFLNHPIKLQNI